MYAQFNRPDYLHHSNNPPSLPFPIFPLKRSIHPSPLHIPVSTSPENKPLIRNDILLPPRLHLRLALHPAIPPRVRRPPVCRPQAVNVRPHCDVIPLHHVAHTAQVVGERRRAGGRGWLRGALGDDARFRGPGEVALEVRVQAAAGTVGGAADGEADIVIEDGDPCSF